MSKKSMKSKIMLGLAALTLATSVGAQETYRYGTWVLGNRIEKHGFSKPTIEGNRGRAAGPGDPIAIRIGADYVGSLVYRASDKERTTLALTCTYNPGDISKTSTTETFEVLNGQTAHIGLSCPGRGYDSSARQLSIKIKKIGKDGTATIDAKIR